MKSIVEELTPDKIKINLNLPKLESHCPEFLEETMVNVQKQHLSNKTIEELVADIINSYKAASINIDTLLFGDESNPINQSTNAQTVPYNDVLGLQDETDDFDQIIMYSLNCLSKNNNNLKTTKSIQARKLDNAYECSLCKKQFFTEFVVNLHIKSHNQEKNLKLEPKERSYRKIYKPNYYSTTTASLRKRKLSSIIRQKMYSSKNKKKQCIFCKNMIHETLFELHINRSHQHNKPYSCVKCNTSFYTKKSYIIHKGREYCETKEQINHPEVRANSSLSTFKQKGKVSSDLYLCYKCPKTLNSLSSLESHLTIHDENRLRKFQCKECLKCFYTNSQYLIHLVSHNDTKFPCDICGKVLNRKESLQCHKRLHNERKFHCVYCQKKFATKATLDLHLRFHTGEYKFECEICSQKFYMRGHYTYHMNSHNGVRYQCPYCDKNFNTPTAVREHKYNHTGMPYNCNFCTKGYPSKYKVCQHIRGCHKIEIPNDNHYKKVYGGKFSENRSKSELHIKKVIFNQKINEQ